MRNLRKGFTLVELIVVITILAILGTIGFISLQGYSGDARNSKRVNDLNALAGAMSTKATEGVTLFALVTAKTANTIASPVLGGTGTVAGEYAAGIPNFQALNIKQSDFQDPSGVDYVSAATSKVGGKYQLAAKMEGNPKFAKVVGDFVSRTVLASTVTLTATGSNNTATIGVGDINKLRVGDTVSGAGLTGVTIQKISADGTVLTFSTGTVTSLTTIAFPATKDDSVGLIKAYTGTAIVTDNDQTNFPY